MLIAKSGEGEDNRYVLNRIVTKKLAKNIWIRDIISFVKSKRPQQIKSANQQTNFHFLLPTKNLKVKQIKTNFDYYS